MSDIERLLTAASDDTDQPLHHSVDDILHRGRRTVRRRRIATASTVALTTAAIIGGITTWSATRPETVGPAGLPTGVITSVDVTTGKVIAPAPPVSPMTDRAIIDKCMTLDKLPTWDPKPWNKPGSLTHRWQVAVKSGTGPAFAAVLLAPDRTVGAHCQYTEDSNGSYGRFPLTAAARNGTVFRFGYPDGLRVPGNIARVLVELPGESVVREALVGTDGFYSLGPLVRASVNKPGTVPGKPRIRGWATDGHAMLDRELPFVVGVPPQQER